MWITQKNERLNQLMPISSGLTPLRKLIYNKAMINYTAGLIVALLLIVEVGFVAIPALRRLIRNIHLTRKGQIATGRYLSSTKAVFFLGEKKRIEFVTWRDSSAKRKELEVLYDPEHPEQVEVRNTKILWLK